MRADNELHKEAIKQGYSIKWLVILAVCFLATSVSFI